MKREDIQPGVRIEAARDIQFHIKGKEFGVHRKGTPGTITSVARSTGYGQGGWTVVDVMFDGSDTPYRCDLKNAEFLFRVLGGVAAQREAVRRERGDA